MTSCFCDDVVMVVVVEGTALEGEFANFEVVRFEIVDFSESAE